MSPAGSQRTGHRPSATRTELRPFDASLPMALLRARETAMRVFRPMLARHDLTEQQWRVLRALSAADGELDAGTLADDTFLLPSSLSRILVNLVDRGLITRTADRTDQRRSLIGLTAAGLDAVRAVAPESEAGYRRIEHEFGVDRLGRLLGELHDLAALDVADVAAARSEPETRQP